LAGTLCAIGLEFFGEIFTGGLDIIEKMAIIYKGDGLNIIRQLNPNEPSTP
jgi:hypothetical protein